MALYQDIATALETEIRSTFTVGDYLPPESQLASRFSINRHTLRRAVDELVAAGMVLRQQGKGTLVLEQTLEYRVGARGRFSESIAAMGHCPKARIISYERATVTSAQAKVMWMEDGEEVHRFETLRLVDGKPVTLITHYLPVARCPELEDAYRGGSLHAVLEDHYGIRLSRTQGLISACLPEVREASLLQYPRNRPLLKIRSNNRCLATGGLIEYSISRSRADCFEYRIEPQESSAKEGELRND